MPAYVLGVFLLLQLAFGQEAFFQFVAEYKWAIIISLAVLLTHISHELTVTLEDYIPSEGCRKTAIKALYAISIVSFCIISITLFRI